MVEIGRVHKLQSWFPGNRKNGTEEAGQLVKLELPKNDDLSLFLRIHLTVWVWWDNLDVVE